MHGRSDSTLSIDSQPLRRLLRWQLWAGRRMMSTASATKRNSSCVVTDEKTGEREDGHDRAVLRSLPWRVQ